MHWQGIVFVLPLLMALSCDNNPQTPAAPVSHTDQRGLAPDPELPPSLPSRPVDWFRSAGVFIGIQTFHGESDLEVPYAADDAVDLAWLFTHETKLLTPDRTALLLAGGPTKDESRRNLAALRHEVRLIEDDRHTSAGAECLNVATIASVVREQARMVGPGGILIVSFATHGLSHEGEHRLLTADASSQTPRGVVLARIVDAIKAERPQRLLLLIDACRNAPRPGTAWVDPSAWQPQMPETLFEDVDLRLSYTALVSAAPGTTALSGDGNGYFTRAILEGLRCNASSQPDGYVTLSHLATYVSERVWELSNEQQQPESRIGDLGPLRLVQCSPIPPPCEILEPKPDDRVGPTGYVRARIHQPELYATVLVCAASNNVCFNQNPGAEPRLTREGETIELAVQYGAKGRFTVRVALTGDREFLRGQSELAAIPQSQDANRLVHWCDPVEVIRKPSRRGGKIR